MSSRPTTTTPHAPPGVVGLGEGEARRAAAELLLLDPRINAVSVQPAVPGGVYARLQWYGGDRRARYAVHVVYHHGLPGAPGVPVQEAWATTTAEVDALLRAAATLTTAALARPRPGAV